MNYTKVITQDFPRDKQVVVFDAEGKIIQGFKSYNTETKEAEVFVTDEAGNIQHDGMEPKTEIKVLEGSYIQFRVI